MYNTPTRFLVGGCSFTTSCSDINDIHKQIFKWPDPLVKQYGIQLIYNLAVSGNGNTAICDNLSYVITTDSSSFSPKDTLVLFNLTGLSRIDLMVPNDHPDVNKYGSWHDVFSFAWITSGGWLGKRSGNSKKLMDNLQKNLGWDQVILSNCLKIINFIERLESNGYRYYFMLMDDQILADSPDFFIDFVKSKQEQWITFGEHLSMHSYAKSLGLLTSDNFHPSLEGDLKIAEIISEKIKHHFS